MLAVAIAFGAVYGLVRLAVAKPEIRASLHEMKLARLRRKIVEERQLTLDEAEDGAYLAREAKDPRLERQFKDMAAQIKNQR